VIVNPGSSRLHAATVRIDDPGPLTDYIGPGDAAFLHGNEGFVAIGQVARFETDSMCAAEEWWAEFSGTIENESEMPGRFGTGPLAIGTFCFDPDNTHSTSLLIVPKTVIGRRGGQAWLTQIGFDRVSPEPPDRYEPPAAPGKLQFLPGSLSEQDWMANLRQVTDHIRAGEASKVVLARDVVAQADGPIDPRSTLRWLASAYGSCWNYLVDGFVGSTPEMLVRREEGLTCSRVLAGTIPRVEGVDDAQQAARLISSTKDLDEHRLAVMSVRQSLGEYLSGMHVPESPYVLTLPNVLHLATDICGISQPWLSTLALAQAAHPSAAVCGVSTDVARQLIRDLEHLDRGRFAGPVGWVDAQGDGEWAIALRCGQLDPADPTRMRLFAGVGVVERSDPWAELVETEAKMVPMKAALRGLD